MRKAKIAVTLKKDTVKRVDQLVREQVYESRSQAVEQAVEEQLARLERRRLVRECAKLNPDFERAMAEEGIAGEVSEWPES